MSIRIKDNTIIAEFSLSQPKRAWKIRSKTRRNKRGKFDKKRDVYKFTPTYGDTIEAGDIFEWMVDNEEIRDILSALKCLSKDSYEDIKEEVSTIAEFYNIEELKAVIRRQLGLGVEIEACLEPKQRKPSELTPFLFVLFPLSEPTEIYYIASKRGERIEHPVGHRIKAGDRLVWIVNEEWIREIVVTLAKLDEDHKRRVIKEVFQVIG